MGKMEGKTVLWYGEMFTAAWKLFKTFRDTHTDMDWMRFSMAAEMIYHKYPYRFMLDLIWVVQEELERRIKCEPKKCYLCGKEIISPKESLCIEGTEHWIHVECINAAKTAAKS